MKSMNPYFRKQWEKDRQVAVTFSERLDELSVLQNQLSGMDQEQQQRWANVLRGIIRDDASPEVRTLALQTIAKIPGDTTVQALNNASTDESEKVRLAACECWKVIGGPSARDMLLTIACKVQETPSVRRAAISELAQFNEKEVHDCLTGLLDDKSPAIQYQTALSLKKLTGRDYGGDIQAWRDFMNGNDVPEPDKSMMAKFWESIQWY